ncbi:MAG TPA: urate hydroxylase PuuD [bacterium]|nr:urate hydroxylase PuuD [bacterium]
MDANVTEWLNLLFRWIHVVAGVTWIGHLYFFNFVNAQVAKTYDADSKKKVVPELMPRALYFFRWGAMYTWVTGVLLLGLLYWSTDIMVNATPGGTKLDNMPLIGISLGIILVPFFIYDQLWKSPLAKNEMVGGAVSFLLVAALAFGLCMIESGRSAFIHIGVLFGSIMFLNVWMRIWPSQKKIIAGIKGTAPAPDAAVPALAGLRSKHNTYMSVPLIVLMISNHFGTVIGSSLNWLFIIVFVGVGFGIAKFLYTKSASAAPAQF